MKAGSRGSAPPPQRHGRLPLSAGRSRAYAAQLHAARQTETGSSQTRAHRPPREAAEAATGTKVLQPKRCLCLRCALLRRSAPTHGRRAMRGRDAIGGSPGHAEGERTRAWLSTAAQECSGQMGWERCKQQRKPPAPVGPRQQKSCTELGGRGVCRAGPLRDERREPRRSGAAATDAHLEATCA
jgi:hypothetical protein